MAVLNIFQSGKSVGKLRYCVIDQSTIRLYLVNLGTFGCNLCENACVKAGFDPHLGKPRCHLVISDPHFDYISSTEHLSKDCQESKRSIPMRKSKTPQGISKGIHYTEINCFMYPSVPVHHRHYMLRNISQQESQHPQNTNK